MPETIKLQNWAAYKAQYEKQNKRKWDGNKDNWCDYCGDTCKDYFDLNPNGLEESTMCLKCANKIKKQLDLLERIS